MLLKYKTKIFQNYKLKIKQMIKIKTRFASLIIIIR